ncbi:MAG: hypothetical protein ACPGTP_03985 [Bacteroidia bacterium]
MRSLILAIALVGIVLVEYGCNDDYRRGGGGYGIPTVAGISSCTIWEIDEYMYKTELNPSGAQWDSFEVKNDFDLVYVLNERALGSSLIADPVPLPPVRLGLDSIQVWNVAHGDSINVTNNMELAIGYNRQNRILISNDEAFHEATNESMEDYDFAHHFYMKQKPLEGGLYKFHFVYYTTSGEVFEGTSERLTLKL